MPCSSKSGCPQAVHLQHCLVHMNRRCLPKQLPSREIPCPLSLSPRTIPACIHMHMYAWHVYTSSGVCYTEKASPTRHRPERQHNARANRRKQCSPNETKPYSKPTPPRKRQITPTSPGVSGMQGNCSTPPPDAVSLYPPFDSTSGQCVVIVREDFLKFPKGHSQAWISNLYIMMPVAEKSQTALIGVLGGDVYMTQMTFAADGDEVLARAIDVGEAGRIYVGRVSLHVRSIVEELFTASFHATVPPCTLLLDVHSTPHTNI